MLELVSYDDAWKQFIENPDQISGETGEFIAEVRYWARDYFDEEPNE